jgi:maltooligosyltrehalose trehalohydrolase
MPFGAEMTGDGRVRFRLWAPAAQRVDLCLEEAGRQSLLPMDSLAGGWFELCSTEAGPGSLYRFRIDGGMRVADPASRHNPQDVHGPSEVIDPLAHVWTDEEWSGRSWEEVVLYELHVGSFTRPGTFRGVEERLEHLARLGVSAVELMPVADFPGRRNWGYDGVLPFAPDSVYGPPEDLKHLVESAHRRGLMVFLDVVYNHFGPEGNYLHSYAPAFFTDRHQTPWGAAINFDGPDSRPVRDFFIHNALYWLTEFHLDGLRLDAVHAIVDDSRPDVLTELAEAVQRGPGRERHVHLVLENDANEARYLAREANGKARWYAAQWNDDLHHALHVLLVGESDGYYADYAQRPVWYTGRGLAEGFVYQGEPSVYRDGKPRGEPSGGLPATAFVSLLQNHDQVGNRAFGERIVTLAPPRAVRAAMAILLLAPSPPLLFMGEEFGAEEPFPFFCDFGGELAAAVTAGRRREFARFARFADLAAREAIPDPNEPATFADAKLDWDEIERAEHSQWLEYYRSLLDLRRREIVPRLLGLSGGAGRFHQIGQRGLRVEWRLADKALLSLVTNLGEQRLVGVSEPAGRLLFASESDALEPLERGSLLPWTTAWYMAPGGGWTDDR